MHFYLYILYSKSLDGFYIGYTSTTVQERLNKHLLSNKGHTSKAKDWTIAYSEIFNEKALAIAREKQIKNWKSKQRIIELIMRNSAE